jgi:hypothetical protein
MIGTLVKYVGPSKGYVYKDFIGAVGLVVQYTACGSDGDQHARIRWIAPVKFAGRTTPWSDFGFKHLEVISETQDKI